MNDSHKKIRAQAELCPTAKMSVFQERCITTRVAAKGLEKKHQLIVPRILAEAKEEFIRITHSAGVCLKTRPVNSDEKRFVIQPYKYLGRSSTFNLYLWVRKQFQSKFLLHDPLVRRIYKECKMLPEILFDLRDLRIKPLAVHELDDTFNNLTSDSESTLLKFYYRICEIVENCDYILDADAWKNLLKVCTGLLSVFISLSIQNTINHVVEVTGKEDLVPYLQLSLKYDKSLYMHPNQQDVILLYSLFISKLVDLGTNFTVLETLKIKSHPEALIHLNITDDYYDSVLSQIAENIMKLFVPIDEYMRKIDYDFREMFIDFTVTDDKEKTFENGCLQIKHFKNYISKASSLLGSEYFAIGQLVLSEYVSSMKESLSVIIEDIFGKLCRIHISENENICQEFENIEEDSMMQPNNSEELIAQ
uniref:Uncharacterized protein LOC114348570 n=1 Tax=Diabrotica virgifera virgifera TaxID=50390 RepID=A0A6P7GYU8_DIAVI